MVKKLEYKDNVNSLSELVSGLKEVLNENGYVTKYELTDNKKDNKNSVKNDSYAKEMNGVNKTDETNYNDYNDYKDYKEHKEHKDYKDYKDKDYSFNKDIKDNNKNNESKPNNSDNKDEILITKEKEYQKKVSKLINEFNSINKILEERKESNNYVIVD